MFQQCTNRAIMFLVLAITAGFALAYAFTTLAQAQGALSLPGDGLAGENRAANIVGPVVDTDLDESDGSCEVEQHPVYRQAIDHRRFGESSYRQRGHGQRRQPGCSGV